MSESNNFKLNGFINPNNKDLTQEQELRRLNVVVKGMVIFILTELSSVNEIDHKTLLNRLNNSIKHQMNKEDDDFKNLFDI